MTIQQLSYIVALADHRHFGKAAQACFVTQPTLTMQVRKVETELDVLLFDRRTQPVKPTEMGVKVIAQARVVLREALQLTTLIGEERTALGGELRVGVIPTLAPYLIPLFLPPFAQRYPEVRLVIDERKTSRILKSLRRGELDLGILVTPVDPDEFEEVALYREPFLAYLPEGHVLWRKHRLKRSDIKDQAMWVLGEGHCFREQTLSLCDRPSSAGHENVLYESGSIETLKQLVRNGSGMTLVPEMSVEADDPHARRFELPEPVRQVSLVARRPFLRRRSMEAIADSIRSTLPAQQNSADQTVIGVLR